MVNEPEGGEPSSPERGPAPRPSPSGPTLKHSQSSPILPDSTSSALPLSANPQSDPPRDPAQVDLESVSEESDLVAPPSASDDHYSQDSHPAPETGLEPSGHHALETHDSHPSSDHPHHDYHHDHYHSAPPSDDSPDDSGALIDYEEEDGGGPVKTFLERLEDLRWMIIKCVAAIAIGMVVCLVAANKIVEALDWPLKNAQVMLAQEEPIVLFTMGTNILWRFHPSDLEGWPLPLGSNRVQRFQLHPVPAGSNTVAFAVQQDSAQIQDAPPTLISLKNYEPLGPFTVAIQLALYGGIGLSSPFVLYFVGQFIVPALRRSEKRFVFQALGIGSVLFVIGVIFCYFVIVQVALNAAVHFSQWMHFGADEWRAQAYISFVCKFMLGMGLAFELPVVILSLVKLGFLDYERLTKFRPYWVVVNMIIAAVLTPDPLSMIMMAIPLQILYEISVFVARYWKVKDRRRSRA